MGFGFNLLLIFIIIPLTIIALLVWIVSKKKIFGQFAGIIWIGIIGLVILVQIIKFIANLNELKQNDIYGEYVIDRTKFSGKQSDWQYEYYRFEITENNEFLFHITENSKICKTIVGKMNFAENYEIPRINLKFEKPKFHIIEENPFLYRNGKNFYYVFYSTKYGAVFFKKDKWKPIER